MYGKKKTKQNKTNHKQTNETWNNKLELYLLFLQLFFTFPFVLFSFTFNYTLFFLSLVLLHIYPPSFAARAQLTLFLWANSAKAILHFRELLSPTFSVLTPTHLIPSLPYSSAMFFLLYVYIFHSSTFFFFFHWPTFVFLISSLFAIDILSDRCQPTIGASIHTSLFQCLCVPNALYMLRAAKYYTTSMMITL